MFFNKKPALEVVTVEGVVLRGGFVSFGVELARTEYALLLKTSTGTQQILFFLSDRFRIKLTLTASGDHVKVVANKEAGDQTLELQEFYNTSLGNCIG